MFQDDSYPMLDKPLQKDIALLQTTIALLQIAMARNEKRYKDNQIKKELLWKFGVKMLLNYRSLLDRRKVEASSIDSQILVIQWVLVVYSQCLNPKKNNYWVNKECFEKKEKEFLKSIEKKINEEKYGYL